LKPYVEKYEGELIQLEEPHPSKQGLKPTEVKNILIEAQA